MNKKKKKSEFLNLSVLEGENKSFAKEIINKKKQILIFRITIASLMFIFIFSMLFLPVFQSKVKLVSEYDNDTDDVRWEKTYRYSVISILYQGLPYFIDEMKSGIQNNDDNLPEMIGVNGETLSIKSDELVKQDVENRRKEQKSSYAKRKNTTTWISFLNRKINNELYELEKSGKLSDSFKKEYADESMDKQNQLMTIFLPEIEAGNIIGLNRFIENIFTTISEEQFNQLMQDYLVGDYSYDPENINQMCQYSSIEYFDILDFYYVSNTVSGLYIYWEECWAVALLDIAFGILLVLFLIVDFFYFIPLIVSLIKIWVSKEITTLNLLNRTYKMFPIFLLLVYPILALLFKCAKVFQAFQIQFWFSGYSFFGIIDILCAIAILVISIMHNKLLKQMKREIDQNINHFVSDTQ